MAMKLGKPMQPKRRKSLEEILQAERERKAGITPAAYEEAKKEEKTDVVITYRIECTSCGNVKNGKPGRQNCNFCDEPEYHRVIG